MNSDFPEHLYTGESYNLWPAGALHPGMTTEALWISKNNRLFGVTHL